MRSAELRGEAGRVERGIRSSELRSTSLFLPQKLVAFESQVLTTKISRSSLVGGRTRRLKKSDKSWGFRPRRSKSAGNEGSSPGSSKLILDSRPNHSGSFAKLEINLPNYFRGSILLHNYFIYSSLRDTYLREG